MEGHIVRKQIRQDGLSDRSLAVALEEYGLLLLQDKALPSVVGIITGERVAGSWWSHSRSQEIFRRLGELESTGDVGGHEADRRESDLCPSPALACACGRRKRTRSVADARIVARSPSAAGSSG